MTQGPLGFFAWMQSNSEMLRKPWLILGKGPSLARRADFPLEAYNTVGLNHVVREQRVTIAHAIDIEVIEHCAEHLESNCDVLVMPWIPHVRGAQSLIRRRHTFAAGARNLEEYLAFHPVLARMSGQGRLLWYNLASAPAGEVRPEAPVIKTETFSSVATLSLLTKAGVSVVRTLGVDGGNSYNPVFQDIESLTKLQTGQMSYDAQFRELAQIVMESHVEFAPLDIESPVRVFVGTEPPQELAFKVLDYSIKKHTSLTTVVEPLYRAVEAAGIEIATPKAEANRPRTPFSFQRFAIPQLKQGQGRAIYLDSDMLVFGDLRELWTWPMHDHSLLAVPAPEGSERSPQFSVMLLDCAILGWTTQQIIDGLDEGRWTYEQLLYQMSAAPTVSHSLPLGWNDLESYSPGRTRLLHYTDMDMQPWLTVRNPLGYLWCTALLDAVMNGAIKLQAIYEQVEKGWIRPSLLWQVENGEREPALIPGRVLLRDTRFIPVHRLAELRQIGKDGSIAYGLRTRALARVLRGKTREVLLACGASRFKRAIDRHL